METRITPPSKISLGLNELWLFKELFYFFTWRDIKVKYKQIFLGFAWAILKPLLAMVIFSVLFGQALNVPRDGIPYSLFAFSGLLLWNVFSSEHSFVKILMIFNAKIIKKNSF